MFVVVFSKYTVAPSSQKFIALPPLGAENIANDTAGSAVKMVM